MKRPLIFVVALVLIISHHFVWAEFKGKNNIPKKIPQNQGKIYDRYGHVQETWKTQPGGSVQFFNKYGQREYSVKPNGAILNRFGQEMGRIKP